MRSVQCHTTSLQTTLLFWCTVQFVISLLNIDFNVFLHYFNWVTVEGGLMCRPSVQVRKSIYHTKRLRKSNRGGSFLQDRSKQWKDSTQKNVYNFAKWLCVMSFYRGVSSSDKFLVVRKAMWANQQCFKAFQKPPRPCYPCHYHRQPPIMLSGAKGSLHRIRCHTDQSAREATHCSPPQLSL